HGGMTTILGLDLAGRRAVVVGGGPTAVAHAQRLVDDGALVRAVSPYACEDLHLLAHERGIDLLLREPEPTDLDDAWLAVAATDAPSWDRRVASWAGERRLWCVASDDAGPARTARTIAVDDLTIGVIDAPGQGARAERVRADLAHAVDGGGVDLRHDDGAGEV